jgi:hypothetical protein
MPYLQGDFHELVRDGVVPVEFLRHVDGRDRERVHPALESPSVITSQKAMLNIFISSWKSEFVSALPRRPVLRVVL